MYQRLHVSIEQNVATVLLNRSERANALDEIFFEEIQNCFAQLSQDHQCRAIVLAAEGKNFCAGIDLSLLASLQEKIKSPSVAHQSEKLRAFILQLQSAFNAIAQCPQPVLAAVQGACVGGGVDMVAACDIRLASEDSFFSIKEIQLAMVADLGTLQRLPKIIAMGKIKEWAFTGRNISPQEALATGLVNEICSRDILLEKTQALAQQIAQNSPIAVRGTKKMLDFMQDHSIAQGLEYVATWNAAMLLSADLQESMQATAQKRKPNFL